MSRYDKWDVERVYSEIPATLLEVLNHLLATHNRESILLYTKIPGSLEPGI